MEFEIFPWILRLVVVLVVLRLLRSALGAARGGSRPRPNTGPPPERAGGALVRDPQCGTYVPEATAIRVSDGRDTHYFCSAACRDAYRVAHGSFA